MDIALQRYVTCFHMSPVQLVGNEEISISRPQTSRDSHFRAYIYIS